jgi:CD109 antigen
MIKQEKLAKILSLAISFISLATLIPACAPKPTAAADSYVAVVPDVLHIGRAEAVSVSLSAGGQAVKDNIEVSLIKDNQLVTSSKQLVNGAGMVTLNIPLNLVEGQYVVQVKGNGFTDNASVTVAKSYLVFVETDKPIYKPGQNIEMRVMTLDPDLKPVAENATVEVLDAKGLKIFRDDVSTDDYGMATLELPISNEPNLGTWKINVTTEKSKNELDVRVEEYVLPKYEITVDLPKDWYLVNEPIKGSIKAVYSFGKPVNGDLKIEALKYVGQWQPFSTVTKSINGSAEFELPAVGYVAGTPAGGGNGNVQLNVSVVEKSTGYTENTSSLLTVAQSPTNLQIIPEGPVFKPGLPFSVLIVTQTPDNKPVDAKINAVMTYSDSNFNTIKTENKTVQTVKGDAILSINPPGNAIALNIDAREVTAAANPASASKVMQASYSPSGNFIHVQQTSEGTPNVGQKITFRIDSTSQAVNFYYEVIARGKVVFSDYTNKGNQISFSTTPAMAPTAKLLVYQILPNSEVAADYLPFDVVAAYPQNVTATFNTTTARPADNVTLTIATQGQAKVGVAVVDKSVFILAENRMNLQQVFDELERLYMQPQAEIHEVSFYPVTTTVGAADVFAKAGVVVMTNKQVPASRDYQVPGKGGSFIDKIVTFFGGNKGVPGGIVVPGVAMGIPPPMAVAAPTAPAQSTAGPAGQLADVQRVRQFFPETWLWFDEITPVSGTITKTLTVPDSITTWMLRTVAVSKQYGLGVAEGNITVFQPFFLTIDLPYSAIRGEEFPVQVAVYNYLGTTQNVQVDITKAGWFDLLSANTTTISVKPNDIGSANFTIRPTKIGNANEIKISARSSAAADAAIKTIIIEPEGVSREIVDNMAISAGTNKTIDTTVPDLVVPDSARAYIALTAGILTQTINGMDSLLQMPNGCGEQNMINFAPDVYITKYLQNSGQLKPEIMAKAEKFMITGYQRELTYRHSDGSFSAFGNNDASGSLWLTAFVLKSFSEAKGIIYIDDTVLNNATKWIVSHQNSDGSFDPVGFLVHQDLLGGLKGKDALTAYTAVALMKAGEKTASAKAVSYLETRIGGMTDPYAEAITTYALEMAKSPKAADAYKLLMSLAKADDNGLHWGGDVVVTPALTQQAPMMPRFNPYVNRSADIETTAYATLALGVHGDIFNAARAAKWLVSQRNASGGFGSTQDTVVALQALTEYAASAKSDADLTVSLKGPGIDKQVKINQSNFDVLQIVEVPVNTQIQMTVTGKGDAIGQTVRRFNLPAVDTAPAAQMLKVDVKYDTTQVAVNDLVKVAVNLQFNPLPEFNIAEAGMIVVDVSIPTGFEAVTDSIVAITKKLPNIKRYDIAGRKVIFYVEDMKPGDKISFEFQVKALYPVKAKGVTSTAYSYYKPDVKGESLGPAVTVN